VVKKKFQKVCHRSILYIPCVTIQLLQFKSPKIAHNCVRFTVILQKTLTATCFGPYWPIIRQHNNCIELSSCLYKSGTVNISNMGSCLKLLYSSLWGTRWHCASNRNVAGLLEFFIYMILPSALWSWGR